MQLCKEREALDVCLTRRQASLCGVFSSPRRLEILLELGKGERTVGDLVEALGMSIAHVSQHLRVMRDQAAVRSRKEGRHVYYRVANPKYLEAIRLVRQGLMEEIELQHRASKEQEL